MALTNNANRAGECAPGAFVVGRVGWTTSRFDLDHETGLGANLILRAVRGRGWPAPC